MKKILSLTAVMALMVITSVALVACGKKTMTEGDYKLTSYKEGTTEYTVTDGAIVEEEVFSYTKVITVAGDKMTTKSNATEPATKDFTYVLDGEKVMVDDKESGYTFKDDTITYTATVAGVTTTIVWKK